MQRAFNTHTRIIRLPHNKGIPMASAQPSSSSSPPPLPPPTPSFNFTIQNAGAQPPSSNYDIVLYTHTLCPYAERTWIALLEKNVPFTLCHIDLSNKPSWYIRSINPRGLVPALTPGTHPPGTAPSSTAPPSTAPHPPITESLDICEWIDTHITPQHSLSPSSAEQSNKMKELIVQGSMAINAGLSFVAGSRGRSWGIGRKGSATSAQQRAFENAVHKAIVEPMQQWEGPFVMGENVTTADIALFPFIKRFSVALSDFHAYDVYSMAGGVVGEWLSSMEARPSCSVSSADDALLVAAYERHKCLDFFDYDTYLTTALHPHNNMYVL